MLFSLCALHIGTYLPQCLLGQLPAWSYFSLHMMVACSLWSEAMLPSWFLVDHVFRHLVVLCGVWQCLCSSLDAKHRSSTEYFLLVVKYTSCACFQYATLYTFGMTHIVGVLGICVAVWAYCRGTWHIIGVWTHCRDLRDVAHALKRPLV